MSTSIRTRATVRAMPAALVVALALALALLPGVPATAALAAPASAPAAKERPAVTLSAKEAGTGGSVTVRGKGWRPDTLLTLLVCGQNAIGGTNACANAEGRAVTTGNAGTFTKKIPVTEPPKPCPCVVRATTVTGAHASADAKFQVAGHPVKPLPKERTGGRLSVLAARLDGDSGLLNWFGAPEERDLVLTVGNLGSDRAKNPVFEIGTAHGVLAPDWERQQWRGTVDPGKKAQVKLPVELSSGAHGDYTVAAKYGEKVLTEQPWDVGRPWGVTLFWILLFVVVPLAVFRIGMAVVDRTRPRRPGEIVSDGPAWKQRLRSRLPSPPRPSRPSRHPRHPAREPSHAARRRAGASGSASGSASSPAPASSPPESTGALPWFTPDTTLTPRPGPRSGDGSP